MNIFFFLLWLILILIWNENPLIFQRRLFFCALNILLDRKASHFAAKTFLFLVFTYFLIEKGCYHEIPTRIPPSLTTPLFKASSRRSFIHLTTASSIARLVSSLATDRNVSGPRFNYRTAYVSLHLWERIYIHVPLRSNSLPILEAQPDQRLTNPNKSSCVSEVSSTHDRTVK